MSGAEDEANGDIAVVIVNYGTPHLTAEAARSVSSHPDVAEIVVVDNGSPGSDVGQVRTELCDLPVLLVEADTNLGFGRGVNLGVSHTCAPLLLFLNSDARLPERALCSLRETLLGDESIGVAAPALFDGSGGNLQAGAHGVFPTLRATVWRQNHRPPDTIWPDWVSGAVMLIRRSDFESVGGFDPDFTMYLEDVHLCWRLQAAGKRVRRDLMAAAFHQNGRSSRSQADRLSLAHASRVTYARKAGLPWVDRLAFTALRALHELRKRTRPSEAHIDRVDE